MHLSVSRYPRGMGMKHKLQSIRSVVVGVLVCQQMQDAGMFAPRLNGRSYHQYVGHTHKETVSSIYSLEKAPLHFHTLCAARAHTHTHTRRLLGHVSVRLSLMDG